MITNQKYEDVAKRAVDSIKAAIATYPKKYTYEILICSPYPLTDIAEENRNKLIGSVHDIGEENVFWIKDGEEGVSGNGIAAYNHGYAWSLGDYIFVLNDDHLIDARSLRAIDFLESELFEDRKYKVTSIGANKGVNIYNSTLIPVMPYVEPYRCLIMGFPVYQRKTIRNYLGDNIFNPRFKHHYADNWLPFWLHHMGEPPIICDDTPLYGFLGPGLSTTHNDDYDFDVFDDLTRRFSEGDHNYA